MIAEAFCHYVSQHSAHPDPCMIEIGCGKGLAASFMCQRGQRLLLIDVDGKAVQQTKIHLSDYKNVEVRCMQSADLGETFDLAYYFMSLHHIEDVDTELEQAKKLLNKNGKLFICDYITKPQNSMHKYDKVPHEGFNKDELVNKLRAHGYNVVSVESLAVLNRQTEDNQEKYQIFVIMAEYFHITHDELFLRMFLTKERVAHLSNDAIEELRKAASSGDVYAQYGYGRWLYFNNPDTDSMCQAEELFYSAKQTLPEAMAAYAQMLRYGETEKYHPSSMDIEESTTLTQQAAAQGSVLAAVHQARHLMFGNHCEAEPQEVARQIEQRLACEPSGDPYWHTLLGHAYSELERRDDALSQYEKAISLGELDAYVYLADILRQRGNMALCDSYMEEGCRKGAVACMSYRADMKEEDYDELLEEEQQSLHKDIDERLHRGLKMGDGICAFYLWLNFYYGGLGYEKDVNKAMTYLQRGVQLADVCCIEQLAELAADGDLPRDMELTPAEVGELWLRAARYSPHDEDALYNLQHVSDPAFLLKHKEELERYWKPLFPLKFYPAVPSSNTKKLKTPVDPMVIIIWPTGHMDLEQADVYQMKTYREMGQKLIGADSLDAVHYSPLLQSVGETADLDMDLVMFVDRDAQMKNLPDNPIGTQIYGQGVEVRGPVIICLQDRHHDCHSFKILHDLVATYKEINNHCGGLLIFKDEDDGRFDAWA